MNVSGTISAAPSGFKATEKSVAVKIGNDVVRINKEDIEVFRATVKAGKPVEVQARPYIKTDANGVPLKRTFKKRDGSDGSDWDMGVSLWFKSPAAGLEDLTGLAVVATPAAPAAAQA